jgi:hypothetical protein
MEEAPCDPGGPFLGVVGDDLGDNPAEDGPSARNDADDQAHASLPTTGSNSRAVARALVSPTPVTR